MKACIFYDQHWALFLGRPTNIKAQDVTVNLSRCINLQSEPNSIMPTCSQALEEEIHEQLVELMNIASQIIEGRDEVCFGDITDLKAPLAINAEEMDASTQVLNLDQQLRDWYGRLPGRLTWSDANAKAAPFGYFLLHQQYHAILILLHRPRENHGSSSAPDISPGGMEDTSEALGTPPLSASDQAMDSEDPSFLVANNRDMLARSVCTQSAVRFAQIVSRSKQRFNLEKISCTGLQPAGTASTALLAAITYTKDEADRRTYLNHLEIVNDAIRSMSRSYQPAARMHSLLQALLTQLLHPDMREPWHGDGNSFDQGVNGNGFKDGRGPVSKNTDVFSFLPVRREHSDSDQIPGNSNKRPHASPIPYASGPSAPFYMPPSPSYSQQPLHQANSISGIFPDPRSELFQFDPLRSLATGVDGMYEYRGYASRGASDNYLRVAPCVAAEGWGLHSLHAASQLQLQSGPGFDTLTQDWIGGGSARTMAHHNHGRWLGSEDAAMGSDTDLQVCKIEDARSIARTSGEDELVALVPISLGHLAQSSGPVVLDPEGNDSNVPPPRNYELDYLSL
jgi:hypothetical protein